MRPYWAQPTSSASLQTWFQSMRPRSLLRGATSLAIPGGIGAIFQSMRPRSLLRGATSPLVFFTGLIHVSIHAPVRGATYHTATFARVVSGDTLMHCTSGYPTPDDELHLDRIARLPAAPELRGWSCHATPRNVELTKIALRAQAYGAGVFEFHFRDHEVPPDSPDYGVSVWPKLLREVADALEGGK